MWLLSGKRRINLSNFFFIELVTKLENFIGLFCKEILHLVCISTSLHKNVNFIKLSHIILYYYDNKNLTTLCVPFILYFFFVFCCISFILVTMMTTVYCFNLLFSHFLVSQGLVSENHKCLWGGKIQKKKTQSLKKN